MESAGNIDIAPCFNEAFQYLYDSVVETNYFLFAVTLTLMPHLLTKFSNDIAKHRLVSIILGLSINISTEIYQKLNQFRRSFTRKVSSLYCHTYQIYFFTS